MATSEDDGTERRMVQNFFAFKGYFPFGSSKLNALQNTIRQRMLDNPLIFDDQQQIIDRAWSQDWSDIKVLANWTVNVADVMTWNAYSVRLDATMFVHATVGGEMCMFFHPNSAYTDLTKHLARYMDYFVCVLRDGAVTVLSASEWETMYRQLDIQFLSATLIQGAILIDNLRRDNYVPSMPKGYFDARYLRECAQVRDQVHGSHVLITEIIMQQYDLETPTQLYDSPFLFDKFPNIASAEELQSPKKILCLLYTTTNGYYVLKNSAPSLRTEYTSTFSKYSKTFTVEGVEFLLDDILREYFGSNKYLPQLEKFIQSDTTTRVISDMKELLREAHHANETGLTALLNVHPYVKAACYLFLLELNKSYFRFASESIKNWLSNITIEQYAAARTDALRTMGFAIPVFFTYLTYGAQENSAFYTWFAASGQLARNRARNMVNVHQPFNVIRAPQHSLFFLRANLVAHIASLSAYIFTTLGVRIGGFDDSTNRDVVEKGNAACMEAVVAMEVLFPRVGSSPKWLASARECGLLNDCRLWIAAWLFTFKMIIDRHVSSQRI
ncbi:MAG: hypothetical protein ACOVQN_00550, partial [Exiguobacterium sp.]